QQIGAAARGDDDGGWAAVLGVGGAGFHAHFAHRFQPGDIHGPAEFAVVGGGAVLHVVGGVDHHAAGADTAVDVDDLLDARSDVGQQSIHVAAVDGQFLDAFGIERGAVGRVGGGDEGNGFVDHDSFADLADGEDRLNVGSAAGFEQDFALP